MCKLPHYLTVFAWLHSLYNLIISTTPHIQINDIFSCHWPNTETMLHDFVCPNLNSTAMCMEKSSMIYTLYKSEKQDWLLTFSSESHMCLFRMGRVIYGRLFKSLNGLAPQYMKCLYQYMKKVIDPHVILTRLGCIWPLTQVTRCTLTDSFQFASAEG